MKTILLYIKQFAPVLLAIIVALIGYEAYHGYMAEHQYYYQMLSSGTNWGIIIWMIVIATLTLSPIYFMKQFSSKILGRFLVGSMIVSGFVHVSYKGGLVGSTGSVMFLFNMIVVLALMAITIGSLYVLGAWIWSHIHRQTTAYNRSDILLSFGLGLGSFLVFNFLLLRLQLFYRPVVWLQLFAGMRLIRNKKHFLTQAGDVIRTMVAHLLSLGARKWLYMVLLIVSLVYIYLSFQLSFIPYSTAWDANHAYMYYPRVWSLNNGFFFSEGPVSPSQIWMVFIAFWFSLLKPLTSFTIAPDTLGVMMNNMSGWFSLLLGLGVLHKGLEFVDKKIMNIGKHIHMGVALGWFYFLLWLTSGMGAFLVFVDNKTDLGVMSLTMLALMSGFMFIEQYLQHTQQKEKKSSRNIYAIVSGLLFGLAIMSKPTAFQDALLFVILLIGLLIGLGGAISVLLIVLGVLGRAETMSIVFYISKNLATKIGIVGLGGTIIQALVSGREKVLSATKPLLIWGGTILGLLVVLKGGYILTQQIASDNLSPSGLVRGILLGQAPTPQPSSKVLVADTGDAAELLATSNDTTLPSIKPSQCSLDAVGRTSDTLFDGLEDIQGGGLTEDLGRYIGFGQRVFTPRRAWSDTDRHQYSAFNLGYPLLRLFFRSPGCYSLNTTAKSLCELGLQGYNQDTISNLSTKIDTGSNQYAFLEGVIKRFEGLTGETDQTRLQVGQQDIQTLIDQYVQGNVVHVTSLADGSLSIAVPYAFLTPLNVVFNRSLQNLSSYYTDIGFMWILCYVLLLGGLVYALCARHDRLILLHIVTLMGWLIWWFIASGIIWYAVGIIAWTIITIASFLIVLYHHATDRRYDIALRGWYGIVVIVMITGLIQLVFNMVRIGSQGGSGPFVRYKGNSARETQFVITPQGVTQQQLINTQYRAKNVFDTQFGHYNAFLNHVQDRADEDGVLIAGTYMQYFLHNQNNITSDGLLTTLRQRGSDENTCALRLRLADKKVKYLVIDPNIGSVVMGGGNASLFDRFFAKFDKQSNTIISHGVISMLHTMIQDGYMRLLHTNNIGAKYAFALSDAELEQAIKSIQHPETKTYMTALRSDNPLLLRSKLAVPRYFGQEAQFFFVFIGELFDIRLQAGEPGIDDLANIIGVDINVLTVTQALAQLRQPNTTQSIAQLNTDLSKDERTVLGYYSAYLMRRAAYDTKGLQELLQQLLQQSLAGGSQLITFELL